MNESRHLLAIDCATLPASVALVGAEGVLGERAHDDEGRADAWIGEAVERCLAQAGLTLADVDAFAACVGPGTFTGIRVGIATALGLAAPRGLPVCGVLSVDALALLGSEHGNEVVACIDARRNQVYAALYAPPTPVDRLPLSTLWGPVVCGVAEVEQQILARDATPVVVGSGAALVGENVGLRAAGSEHRLAAAVGRLALRAWPPAALRPQNWPAPEPLYMRPPDARPPRNPLLEARRRRSFERP